MEVLRKDVVVAGLGGFGSAALWRLAERGVDVAGIERHGIGHHLGSSNGATRLFRIACQEHPGLPAVELSHEELAARQPQYAGLTPDDVAVWDPGAGICYPGRMARCWRGSSPASTPTARPTSWTRRVSLPPRCGRKDDMP
jgi:sarcosine oxidase